MSSFVLKLKRSSVRYGYYIVAYPGDSSRSTVLGYLNIKDRICCLHFSRYIIFLRKGIRCSACLRKVFSYFAIFRWQVA